MATDFIAGCIGGGAAVIVGHPLDTVKVRLQTQTADNVRYKGTFHALVTIGRQESIAGLYRGITSPLYGVSLVNALVFGVYGCLQPFVNGHKSAWAQAMAGSAAGAVQSLVCSPMELVKIRMQLNESTGKQPSSFTVLKSIYDAHGVKAGVFKGWLITLLREIPGFGAYFGSYEMFTHFLEKRRILTSSDGQLGTLGMMMCGGTAGVTSWLACFPMDVIKTRFQSDTQGKYNGIWDCAKKTYASEGYTVFTRTLPSLLIRAFPMNAITFPIVTWIIRLSDRHKDTTGMARNEIEALLSQTANTAAKEIYQKIYNTPSYHMLTPRIPTMICTETQNPFYNSRSMEEYEKSATICPCCALAEVHELRPLFYDDRSAFPRTKSTKDVQLSLVTDSLDNGNAEECGGESVRSGEKAVVVEKPSILGRILAAFLPLAPSGKPESKCNCGALTRIESEPNE